MYSPGGGSLLGDGELTFHLYSLFENKADAAM
jgi:hypothetical protein